MPTKIYFVLSILIAVYPHFAFAYIGPGAGLGALGTAIALLAAVILLVVGFVWYPLKRFLRNRKSRNGTKEREKN